MEAGLYESEEETAKREEVLGRIQEVIACSLFFFFGENYVFVKFSKLHHASVT